MRPLLLHILALTISASTFKSSKEEFEEAAQQLLSEWNPLSARNLWRSCLDGLEEWESPVAHTLFRESIERHELDLLKDTVSHGKRGSFSKYIQPYLVEYRLSHFTQNADLRRAVADLTDDEVSEVAYDIRHVLVDSIPKSILLPPSRRLMNVMLMAYSHVFGKDQVMKHVSVDSCRTFGEMLDLAEVCQQHRIDLKPWIEKLSVTDQNFMQIICLKHRALPEQMERALGSIAVNDAINFPAFMRFVKQHQRSWGSTISPIFWARFMSMFPEEARSVPFPDHFPDGYISEFINEDWSFERNLMIFTALADRYKLRVVCSTMALNIPDLYTPHFIHNLRQRYLRPPVDEEVEPPRKKLKYSMPLNKE